LAHGRDVKNSDSPVEDARDGFPERPEWPMSRPKVGKIDWQVLHQLPAIHGIQFFCDAMTAYGR
jgi:hypothetical protein